MDLNAVKIDENIDEANKKSEISENVTEIITQPQCEPYKEHNTEIGNSNEASNNDKNVNDVVPVPEMPSDLSGVEKPAIIEPHKGLNQPVGDVPEIINADDIRASSAATPEHTEEAKEVIDIDEILSSIHEGSTLESVDENEPPTTLEQKMEEKVVGDQGLCEDVALLSDGESGK